jgi:hypothetical protein
MVHCFVQRWPWGKETHAGKVGVLKLHSTLLVHGAQSDPAGNVVVVLDDVVVVVEVVVVVLDATISGAHTIFGVLGVS